MEIVLNKIDTKKATIDIIVSGVLKIRDSGKKTGSVNLSLDLTRPEKVDVEFWKNSKGFNIVKMEYVKDGECIATDDGARLNDMNSLQMQVDRLFAKAVDHIAKKKEAFELECYQAYQLDWMISHNVSLQDAFNTVRDIVEEDMYDYRDDPECDDDPLEPYQISNMICDAEDSLLERGFGSGSIFVCKDEFLGAEYLDPYYMDHLLSSMPNSADKKAEWEMYTGLRIPEESLEVNTTAGAIRATKSIDPDQPGICVMYQPSGYDCEIDAAYVSVMENPDYQTDYHETPNDLILMTWGDATTEDYTNKEIVRRKDVITGLGTANNY